MQCDGAILFSLHEVMAVAPAFVPALPKDLYELEGARNRSSRC